MLMAAMPDNDAVVTGTLSAAVHLALGVGSYVLPFILAIIGITFLYRKGRERLSLRAAVGMAVLYIALLGFIALFTPISSLGTDDPDLLFLPALVERYGGYIGAGIAWIGIVALGRIITGVILVGVMIIGLVIVGFSISRLLEKARRKAHDIASKRFDGTSRSVLAPPPARIRRRPDAVESHAVEGAAVSEVATPAVDAVAPDAFVTRQLPAQGQKKRKLKPDAAKIPVVDAADPHMTVSIDDVVVMDAQQTKPMTRKLGRSAPEEESRPRAAKSSKAKARAAETPAPIPQDGFQLPSMALLERPARSKKSGASQAELQQTAQLLQQTLEDFGVMAQVVGWVAGPTVTLFKVDLPSGVRVSRITVLGTDIALALATSSVRIFAPIPGTNYVGIEVPNAHRETVYLSEVLEDAPAGPLQIAIGKDVEGESIVCRHHRFGQVGVGQCHDHVHPHARHARRGALHHDRSETRRVHALQRHPASVCARGHRTARSGRCPCVGRGRDGAASQGDERGRGA